MGSVPGLEGSPGPQVPQAYTILSSLTSSLGRLASVGPSCEEKDSAQQVGQDCYGHQSHFCDRWLDCGDILWTSAKITREFFQSLFMDLGVLVRGVSTAFIVFNVMVLRDVQVSPAFPRLLEVCTISMNVLSIAVSSRSLHECRTHKSLEMLGEPPLPPLVEPKTETRDSERASANRASTFSNGTIAAYFWFSLRAHYLVILLHPHSSLPLPI